MSRGELARLESKRKSQEKYRRANRQKLLDKGRKYYQKNKKKLLEYSIEYRKRYPEKCKETSRKYREAHPGKSRADKLRLRYNLTPEAYNKLARKQRYKCKICGNRPEKLFVDHDHATGKVRGLLCCTCNSLLGKAKDSRKILWAADKYLAEYEND